jgi:peptide-methionine (S)-S-oxide reductase
MKTERAIFSAGCFWHVQHDFDAIKGVIKTTVGYIGGNEKKFPNPKYEMLQGDKTGYAEAVEILFNSDIISYEKILDVFWKIHDPTLKNRQGPDVGTQYRSGIFYLNEFQKEKAEKSKEEIEKKISKKVHTIIEKAGTFFPAEEYHQKYFEKKGINSCPVN